MPTDTGGTSISFRLYMPQHIVFLGPDESSPAAVGAANEELDFGAVLYSTKQAGSTPRERFRCGRRPVPFKAGRGQVVKDVPSGVVRLPVETLPREVRNHQQIQVSVIAPVQLRKRI